MKTLTLVSQGLGRPDYQTLMREEAADRYPRLTLYQRELHSDLLDEQFLTALPPYRRAFYKILPVPVAQILEALIVRNQYDVIISWTDRLGYPLAILLRIIRSQVPHIILDSWISNPKKRRLIRLAHSHLDRFLLWSSVQQKIATSRLRIPESKIIFVRKFADQEFYRPFDQPTDTICAAGMEGRDYPTLIEALRGLPIPCHIAAGLTRGKLFATVKAIGDQQELPPNITVGFKGFRELRELYARSRFVVVPLLPSETDHGLTCILESMAMGKAVICSRTRGQVDVIEEGKTGLFVPQGDPKRLREAIMYLWENPDIACEMGRNGRARLEKFYTLEQFIDSIKTVVCDVMRERSMNGSYPFH